MVAKPHFGGRRRLVWRHFNSPCSVIYRGKGSAGTSSRQENEQQTHATSHRRRNQGHSGGRRSLPMRVFQLRLGARLQELIEEDIASPSGMVKSIDAKGSNGFLFGDTFVCHHIEGFKDAVFNSRHQRSLRRPLRLEVNLLFDQILVKEPDTSTQPLVSGLHLTAGGRRSDRRSLTCTRSRSNV